MLLPLILALSYPSAAIQEPERVAHQLVIRDVDVLDVRTGKVARKQTIVVDDGRITAIRPLSDDVRGERTLEGRERLAVPGFVDTHVHIQLYFETEDGVAPDAPSVDQQDAYRALLAERYVTYGTTTIADMGQPDAWIAPSLRWQADPRPTSPDLMIVGGSLNTALPWDRNPPAHHVLLENPDAARAKVREYARRGIRNLKLYWKLEPAEMEAVVAEAHVHGLGLYAHIDNNINSIDAALALGVTHYEHFFTLVPGILNLRQHRPALERAYGLEDVATIDEFAASMVLFFDYIRHDEALHIELMALLERLGERGCTLSTALNVLASATGRTSVFTSFNDLPEREAPALPSFTAEGRAGLAASFDSLLYYLKAAHEAGVKLRIGTDSRRGGQALEAELALFVEAGFTVAETLRIASLNGAEAMGIADHCGSLEVGKAANLVLFEASPFDDPRNFFAEKTVLKDGVVYGGG